MALFEFELRPVEEIKPWGEPGKESLSWFALTDGTFRMRVGSEILFRYRDEVFAPWGKTAQDPDYPVASFARDMLLCVTPGMAPLPDFFTRLVSDWDLAAALLKGDEVDEELHYTAWRWLGERAPWTSYLSPSPNVYFLRIGDDVHVRWDSRGQTVDGQPAWTTELGVHVLPVAAFLAESHDFADRLLSTMEARIDGIVAGTIQPQIEVDIPFLRVQHETWRTEFAGYFGATREPDIPWDETEAALREIAEKKGLRVG